MTTAIDWTRAFVGLLARAACWACVFYIVVNAIYQAIDDDEVAFAVFEAAFFPATFLIYPFAADGFYSDWPLADGTNLIPFLVAAFVLYPVSTFVGGLGPMEEGV